MVNLVCFYSLGSFFILILFVLLFFIHSVQAEAEVLQLRRHIEELERTMLQREAVLVRKSDQSSERVNMLQTQLQVYADDFRTERQDRERAQETIQQLQRELTNYQVT